MKRIRPDFYNEFHCIADSCTITCCQEWKIAVDPDTNRKWKKVSAPADVPEQKKNLSAYTEKKDGLRVIQLDSDHRCPFLSENRLCRLVTAYDDTSPVSLSYRGNADAVLSCGDRSAGAG